MARQGFKRWWTRIVPLSVERSTYVLLTSFVLLLLYRQWQPISPIVWSVQNSAATALLDGVFWLGWIVLVASTFLISHFELFGLSQVFKRLFGKQPSDAKFRAPLLYRYVRHPIYLGALLAVWATPFMTAGPPLSPPPPFSPSPPRPKNPISFPLTAPPKTPPPSGPVEGTHPPLAALPPPSPSPVYSP